MNLIAKILVKTSWLLLMILALQSCAPEKFAQGSFGSTERVASQFKAETEWEIQVRTYSGAVGVYVHV